MAAVLVLTFVGLTASNSMHRERLGGATGVAFADTRGMLRQDSLQSHRIIQEDSLPTPYYQGTYDTLHTDGIPKRL